MYTKLLNSRFALHAVAAAGVVAWSAAGIAQPATVPAGKVSDAQVEASVLKALAGASDLATQPITTTTVYGVVTLSGSVQTEAMRTETENVVARTAGVQKVVDEMTLAGEANGRQLAQEQDPTPPQEVSATQLPQDGPPAEPQASPAYTQDEGPGTPGAPQYGQRSSDQASTPGYPGAPEYRRPYADGQQPPPPPAYGEQDGYGSPQQQQQGYAYPRQQSGYGYPQQQQGYGDSQQQQSYGYPQQQQAYGPPAGYGRRQHQAYGAQQPYPPQAGYGGQQAGQMVTIPNGAVLQVRINQPLDSGRAQAGERFNGIVVSDVIADGAVAIPRGAAIEGTVVDAQPSGALKGRGSLSLQLTSVSLGGKVYPLASDIWAHNGGDKTTETVDKTVVGAGLGGLVGAAAGGGEGAAIGAGIGAALGLGSSASSGRGQVFIPSEGLLTFHLSQPVQVATVSQMEMDRMAQGAGPAAGGGARLQRRYPPAYYGPVYYRPYPPYAYPYYRYPY